jgi:NADPH:quinone reductase-like Zn-dependent oxidoreductase
MKAAVYDRYGPPDVVHIEEVERPRIGEDQLLVRVIATTVTTADWRLRAAAFPPGMRLAGRLFGGLTAPRHRILGGEFAGRVHSVGVKVTRFQPGDAVYGFSVFGAHAEYMAVSEGGPVSAKPAALNFEEAAAVPFGGHTALVFLRDLVKLEPGQSILIGGASGNVGVFAVQLARHFGAHVTAICSTRNVDLVSSLGASRVIDYTKEDVTLSNERFDVILDTAGTTTRAGFRHLLKPGGKHALVEAGIGDMLRSILPAGGIRIVTGIAGDKREHLETLAPLIESGAVRPVIDRIVPLDRIVEAHQLTESRRKRGSVVVKVAEDDASALAT